jgi:hypothetical protein
MNTDNTSSVFNFMVGWGLMIALLTLINKTKLGHVLTYYSLLLFILFILVTQYKKLAPLLINLPTIQQEQGGTA